MRVLRPTGVMTQDPLKWDKLGTRPISRAEVRTLKGKRGQENSTREQKNQVNERVLRNRGSERVTGSRRVVDVGTDGGL